MTDPIADLLTRIRNATMARKDHITVPYSGVKMDILRVLKEKGFIETFEEVNNGHFKEMSVVLGQHTGRNLTLKRISKPGQRIYVKNRQLKKIHGGMGISILSTPKGIMSQEKAKKMNLGGELICEIY